MKQTDFQKGFTLIESLIALSLAAVIFVGMMHFTLNLIQTKTKIRVISEVATNGRLVQDVLTDAARHATGIVTALSSFGENPGRLVFTMENQEEGPTIFSVNEGIFFVQRGITTSSAISTEEVIMTQLIFTNLTSADDIGIIQVQFTLRALNDSGNPFFDYEESFQTVLRIARGE